MLQNLTIVLGGAASGKSDIAERVAAHGASRKVYIATAEARDAEMSERIARHRAARAPDGWIDIEAPFDLPGALAAQEADAILVDCLTLWLTNHLLAESTPDTDALCRAIAAQSGRVVLVSNEVGQGIVPGDALSRRFRDAQGALNRRLAAEAGSAIAVMAGLPLALKGPLPAPFG